MLRSAGAELRTDLPPKHHGGESGKTCVVFVDAEARAGGEGAGLLERASARGVHITSQQWFKQCLLEQRVLPLGEVSGAPMR